MQEIKCPKCGEVFQVDENGYAQILQQVRDKEFQKEIERRENEMKRLIEANLEKVKTEHEMKCKEIAAEKERIASIARQKISELQSQISNSETAKDLAVSQALAKQKEDFNSRANAANSALAEKDREIDRLKMQLNAQKEAAAMDKKTAVMEAVADKTEELSEKEKQILLLESSHELEKKNMEQMHAAKVQELEGQVAYYKDFKARQSTKMVGESLEQYCYNQFNMIRMGAFPKAYFEKDNDASSGNKGDFIFRELSDDGIEFISIMFEMKNELDETATKHKNEDFFAKLDKDRKTKNCEYAVLVSMLEADNEYYNNGIVDVSYKYEKMYVIRPQFMIPLITLLRNAALKSLEYRRELEQIKNQQIDITNFESNINAFKEGFARNYRLASERFQDAISEIDKSIEHLEKIKKNLISSENNLRLANNKAEDLTIKKLTKNAPSVKVMFDELNQD
ncbi:MAG: DUF2130 domain-containing protein [Phascolarctobacterium sp.]|nr:DUF2130 domain-containing protein [Phascolarctobacterium sp.]